MASKHPVATTSLDPAVLDKLSKLSLVARSVVEGFMAGAHRSPLKGASVEFAQHREYVPGDDPRFIDERIFAKTGRLVVKEFVEETNFSCHVAVDTSASMGFGSVAWTKLDYARWCAAALAYLVLKKRDWVGLVTFDTKARRELPPGGGAPQTLSIFRELEALAPRADTNVGALMVGLADRLRRRGIVVVISDFFDDPETILDGARRLHIAGHEPILVQVLDPQEISFELDGHLRLDPLESGDAVKVDARSIRQAYVEEFGRHQDALTTGCRAIGADFVSMTTTTGLDVALSAYLTRRMARRRHH
ncbi:MAG: DUF58 domain-containing protein [Planctomycetota bacterium]